MTRSVIIVGAGQGGLSAAIHARLRGFDVLVLETSSGVGGKAQAINTDGFRWDPGPSIVILPRIYEDVFKRAGRRLEDYLQFHRLETISRVYFEGQEPFDLPSDSEACLDVLREVAPEDLDAFERFMAILKKVSHLVDETVFSRPFETIWHLLDPKLVKLGLPFDARKTYKQLVDSWFKNPILRAFFYGFPSYGGQTYDSHAPGALMIPFLMLDEGVFYPQGGVAAIPEAFYRLACELGVEFRFEAKVKNLITDQNRVTHASLEGGELIAADSFISNVDRLTVQSWIGAPSSASPSFSYFTIQWGLKARKFELPHHSLLVPKDFENGFEALYRKAEFPKRPIVYLNDTVGIDPLTVPSGAGNLFAVVTCPALVSTCNWQSEAKTFEDRTVSVMSAFGLDIVDSEVVVKRVQTPAVFAERDGSYRGSLYGPTEFERAFKGLFPLTNRDPKFKNLFYCGGSVQPGAGLPMVTLSGRFAAEMI